MAMNIGTPITIDKLPFEYTGAVDAYEYSPGKYYAVLKSSGMLTPKRDFTADLELIGAGETGKGSSNTTYYSGAGGRGGNRLRKLNETFFASFPDAIIIGTTSLAETTINSAHHFLSTAIAYGGVAGADGGSSGSSYGAGTASGAGKDGTNAFDGDEAPFSLNQFKLCPGGGGGAAFSGGQKAGGIFGGGDGVAFGGTPGTANMGEDTYGAGGGGHARNTAAGGRGGYGAVLIRGALNSQPIITSIFSGDLGIKNSDFSITYSVDDPDGDELTVTESIDGVPLRTYTPVLQEENSCDVTGLAFMSVLNGARTLDIKATDPYGDSDTLSLTFTKEVTSCSITLAEPMEVDDLVQRMVMSIIRHIPTGANFQVLVCNNGLDNAPTWEDATQTILSGINHLFENTTVTAVDEEGQPRYGYNFKITASRQMLPEGGYGDGGFISSIGGAFE